MKIHLSQGVLIIDAIGPASFSVHWKRSNKDEGSGLNRYGVLKSPKPIQA